VRSGQAGPLKSRYARREIPLSFYLADQLRTRRAEFHPVPGAPVFAAPAGGLLHRDNVRNRVIKPAAEEAGAEWAGWHTFRHTCASLLFDRGANAKQVQCWLGHHSPAFTLETYVHLLEGRIDAPLEPVDLVGSSDAEKDAQDAQEQPDEASVNESANGSYSTPLDSTGDGRVVSWLGDTQQDVAVA
jgi:Phage integrase family